MAIDNNEERIAEAELGDIIQGVAEDLVQNQVEINEKSAQMAVQMAGVRSRDRLKFGKSQYSLLELGYEPPFYQFSDISMDLKLSLSFSRDQVDGGLGVKAAAVNADYCSQFGYNGDGASRIQAKLVPSFPPDIFEARVGKMIEESLSEGLEIIQKYAELGDASPLTMEELLDLRLKNLLDGEPALNAYKTELGMIDPLEISDIPALQGLIDRVNSLQLLQALNAGNVTGSVTLTTLRNTGLARIVSESLEQYKAAVTAATAEDFQSLAGFQALIDGVNISIIRDMNSQGDASDLNVTQLEATGVQRVLEVNFEKYRETIAGAAAITDEAALQLIVDRVNLAVLRYYNVQGDATALSMSQLEITGLLHLSEANIKNYRLAVVDAPETSFADLNAVQNLVFGVNLQVIDAYAVANDASFLTVSQLESAGTTNIMENHLEEYRFAIAGATGIADLAALQTLVDQVNALSLIRNYNFLRDASAMTFVALTAVGLTNLDEAKLSNYRQAVATAGATDLADRASLQALLDGV